MSTKTDDTVLMTPGRRAPLPGRLRPIDVPLLVIAAILALTLAGAVGTAAARPRVLPAASSGPATEGAAPTPQPTIVPSSTPQHQGSASKDKGKGHGDEHDD